MTTSKTQMLDMWVVAKAYLERTASPGSHTWKAKKRDLILFIDFVSELHDTRAMMKHLTVGNMKAFREHQLKSYAPTSVKRSLSTLRHFGRMFAEFYGLRFELKGVKDPSAPPRPPVEFTPAQLLQIREEFKAIRGRFKRSRDTLCFEIGLATGLRASEIIAPTIAQICWDTSYFRALKCKGGKFRDIYIPAYMHKPIRDYMREREGYIARIFNDHGKDWDKVPFEKRLQYPLFVSAKGSIPGKPETFRMSYCSLKTQLNKIGKKLGYRVYAHALRHTRAHGIMRQTKDLRIVQQALGHSDIKISMIYAGIKNEEVNAAQESIQL